LDALRPFLRETFTETWAGLLNHCEPRERGEKFNARMRLRDAITPEGQWHVWGCDAREGRVIEAALYRRARSLRLTPVLTPPRKAKR
jgi:hypothetical protein